MESTAVSPRPFTARYSSICPECGGEIVADLDDIVMTDDGAVHEDCAPAEPGTSVTFPM